jgi:hypothetical protein
MSLSMELYEVRAKTAYLNGFISCLENNSFGTRAKELSNELLEIVTELHEKVEEKEYDAMEVADALNRAFTPAR